MHNCVSRSQDRRIPRIAFVIFVDTTTQGGNAIRQQHVGIWPCTKYGILINGKLLKQRDSKGCETYTHLHSGDVIQVCRTKFVCDFVVGPGKEPRPNGERFVALRNERHRHRPRLCPKDSRRPRVVRSSKPCDGKSRPRGQDHPPV